MITIAGRLGKDPETATTTGGKIRATFSVATSEGRDETQWFRVVAWEKQAELADAYLRKGSFVCVAGAMRSRKYNAQDGTEREVWEVTAQRVTFGPRTDDAAPAQPQPKAAKARFEDDEIPF